MLNASRQVSPRPETRGDGTVAVPSSTVSATPPKADFSGLVVIAAVLVMAATGTALAFKVGKRGVVLATGGGIVALLLVVGVGLAAGEDKAQPAFGKCVAAEASGDSSPLRLRARTPLPPIRTAFRGSPQRRSSRRSKRRGRSAGPIRSAPMYFLRR